MPFGANSGVCGSRTSSGNLYSVMSPVFGSSLPTYAFEFAVNQRLPSLSSSRPWGPDAGVFSGNSLNWPVFGSKRPITFANIPVHQIDPSGPGSGSCGREPSDGTVHSLIDTFTEPGRTTAGGRGCSGKWL